MVYQNDPERGWMRWNWVGVLRCKLLYLKEMNNLAHLMQYHWKEMKEAVRWQEILQDTKEI